MKNKKSFLRSLLCGVLSVGLLVSNPAMSFAANEGAAQTAETPTPTPDPHMPAYYQPADTNSLEDWPEGPNIEGEAAVLMEMNTGTILYSKNADEKLYPASITKILTGLLACEHLDMNGNFVMTQSAAFGIEPGSSSIYGDADEEFTIQQALMALMLESANEMALALAELTSGSTKKFVELMNERARQIGCTNTHFNNPNGLPDETHYTTAHDMALIARTAWQNSYFRRFATTDYYEIPPTNKQPETRYMRNHHKMMAGGEYAYDGVQGGKTGYTEAAGNTLVTYARKNGLSLVCVVLNSIGGSYSDTASLLDYGFNQFSIVRIPVKLQSYPLQVLPSEKYLLRDGGNLYAFYYNRYTYVTVPSGTDVTALTEEIEWIPAFITRAKISHRYYFHGYPVGQNDQYEKEILADLLI